VQRRHVRGAQPEHRGDILFDGAQDSYGGGGEAALGMLMLVWRAGG
jgi:hypothetical protein